MVYSVHYVVHQYVSPVLYCACTKSLYYVTLLLLLDALQSCAVALGLYDQTKTGMRAHKHIRVTVLFVSTRRKTPITRTRQLID